MRTSPTPEERAALLRVVRGESTLERERPSPRPSEVTVQPRGFPCSGRALDDSGAYVYTHGARVYPSRPRE